MGGGWSKVTMQRLRYGSSCKGWMFAGQDVTCSAMTSSWSNSHMVNFTPTLNTKEDLGQHIWAESRGQGTWPALPIKVCQKELKAPIYCNKVIFLHFKIECKFYICFATIKFLFQKVGSCLYPAVSTRKLTATHLKKKKKESTEFNV